jgi:hypothetical protein
MRRYFFHIRNGSELIQDQEGTELSDLPSAREAALEDMRHFVGDAIKNGKEVPADAIIVFDDEGRRVAAIPLVAVLPQLVLDVLVPEPESEQMTKSEEYRQYAEECERMAETAVNPSDRAAWLKLANSWLQMLPQRAGSGDGQLEGWPKPSDEDSQASH